MDDEKTNLACGREHGGDRLHGTRHLRNIVAERFAEAAGLQKIALHVDDDQCGFREVEFERRGLSLEDGFPGMVRFVHEVFHLSKVVVTALRVSNSRSKAASVMLTARANRSRGL